MCVNRSNQSVGNVLVVFLLAAVINLWMVGIYLQDAHAVVLSIKCLEQSNKYNTNAMIKDG